MANKIRKVDSTVKVRPLRYGIIVDPRNLEELRKAIEVNCSLWGGNYNPLVPWLNRVDRSWKSTENDSEITAMKLAKGYVQAFDPDVLIARNRKDVTLEFEGHRRIHDFRWIESKAGIKSARDIQPEFLCCLIDIIEENYKYQRIDNSRLFIPSFEKTHALTLSAIFGSLDSRLLNYVKELPNISAYVDFPKITLRDVNKYLTSYDVSTRQITATSLESTYTRTPELFIFDPQKGADIVRLWNMRAAGNYIYPFPLSNKMFNDIELIPELFDELQNKNRNRIQVRVSPAVTSKKLLELAKDVTSKLERMRKLSTIDTYPNFHYKKHNQPGSTVEISRYYSSIIEEEIEPDEEDTFHLTSRRSRLPNKFPDIEIVNAVDLRFRDGPRIMAEVFPDCDDQYTRMGLGETISQRINTEGIIAPVSRYSQTHLLDSITSEKILCHWLASQGWESGEISTAGKMCNQVVKLLDGTMNLVILSIEGLRAISRKGERVSGLNWDQCVGILLENGNCTQEIAERRLKIFIEHGILAVGHTVDCSVCNQRNWYSHADLNNELLCNRCLNNFSISTVLPEGIKWACRVQGPFAHTEFAGSLCPLLTFGFLNSLSHFGTSTVFGYKGIKNGLETEIDILSCFQLLNRTTPELVIAECKDPKFKKKDIDKLQKVAEEFGNVYVVFSTTRMKFQEDEKGFIKSYLNKLKRTNNQSTKIIVLTYNEISCWHPSYNWKDVSAAHKLAAESFDSYASLDWLSHSTLKIHLDV